MDRLWVKDVEVGSRAAGVFLVVKKQQATGRNAKVFLRLTLQDKTGRLDARVWDRAEELGPLFEVGDRVEVVGQVGAFQGRPQLTVEGLQKSQAELDAADFEFAAPAPARAAEDGTVESIRQLAERVSDPHVRALLLAFLDDEGIAAALPRAPAAKEVHHAYAGGLAEHILSCMQLAHRVADQYPMADRDLLVAGALLHDIGKVAELSWDKGGTSYTDEGKLVGHLVMTAQWIREKASAIPNFPRDLEIHLTHIVLAHHGRLEYGSPKLPATLEAYLVHALDEMDSRVGLLLAQMAKAPGERWADPQKHWERLLWKGPAPTEAGKRRGPPWKGQRRRERTRKRGAEGAREPAAAPVAGERPAREERQREARGPVAAPAGERRGPRRPEAGPRAPKEEKLTFKPFSALPGQEAPAAEQETELLHEPGTTEFTPEARQEAGAAGAPPATPSEEAAPAGGREAAAPPAGEEMPIPPAPEPVPTAPPPAPEGSPGEEGEKA